MINFNCTPCEELGYKVGDQFVVLEELNGFEQGQIVTLYKDDGSSIPLFAGSNKEFDLCDDMGGAYLALCEVKKIKQGELK